MTFNRHGLAAIYRLELARFGRTALSSLATPVITTSLYFVVFGSAIGSRIDGMGGVSYSAFIVPGLIMLSVLTESVSNASYSIFMPKWSGTIYELLSAPVSSLEIVLGYVGAAATKSVILGGVILATSTLFVDLRILHPFWMVSFLVLTSVAFCLFGFILGIWARSWEQLSIIPALVMTPLTFLGGAFYSIEVLQTLWRTFSPFNPVVYLISGLRWSFFGQGDVPVGVSLVATLAFLCTCLAIIAVILRTGYRLKR